MAEQREQLLGQLVDHLPYSDGSGRRRFVTGTITCLSLAGLHWSGIKDLIATLGEAGALSSPGLMVAFGLVIYAVGSVVEIVGEQLLRQ